jgi:hypothetical protein
VQEAIEVKQGSNLDHVKTKLRVYRNINHMWGLVVLFLIMKNTDIRAIFLQKLFSLFHMSFNKHGAVVIQNDFENVTYMGIDL